MAGGLSTSDAPLGLGGAAGGAASPLYYPAVALAALTRVLREPSLVAQHRATVPPIVTVLSELGTRATPLLPDVMPLLLAAASGPDPLLVEAVVRELGALVPALGLLSRPYVPPLLELVLAHLPGPHASIQAHCICLVEARCERTLVVEPRERTPVVARSTRPSPPLNRRVRAQADRVQRRRCEQGH